MKTSKIPPLHFDLDDIDIESTSVEDITLKKDKSFDMYYGIGLGTPVSYSSNIDKFIPAINSEFYHMGVVLSNEGHQFDVLYKGFLLKDCLKISATIKENYLRIYVKKNFEALKDYIKTQMPRHRKLKRLNLKLITKQQTQLLYRNLDKIIDGYEQLFGYEYANKLKAQIVTTPIYIQDNNRILIYKFETNEFYDPDQETSANFLCYFTFSY